MTLLTPAEVHATPEVAEWLRKRIDFDDQTARTYLLDLPSAWDARRAQTLILENFNYCWTRYDYARQGAGATLTRDYVDSLYLSLRQAAWHVRLCAWLYRSWDGWNPEWFRMDPEESGPPDPLT